MFIVERREWMPSKIYLAMSSMLGIRLCSEREILHTTSGASLMSVDT
jgi:hypothetical protein